MSHKLHETLIEVTREMSWLGIDEIWERVAEAGGFDDEPINGEAVRRYQMVLLRRELKRLKDATGFPTFASIVRADAESGESKRVYLQEQLFDIEQYRQVIDYHANRTNYHAGVARRYAKRAEERYGIQIPLPFDLIAIGVA